MTPMQLRAVRPAAPTTGPRPSIDVAISGGLIDRDPASSMFRFRNYILCSVTARLVDDGLKSAVAASPAGWPAGAMTGGGAIVALNTLHCDVDKR